MSSNTTHYWVNNIDPVLVHIYGDFGIRYYGLAYILAFVASAYMLKLFHYVGKSQLDSKAVHSSMFALILGVMIGGRLGYMIFYDWNDFILNPLVLFKIWQGGMSSHGGFIGVAVALLWISRQQHTSFLRLSDLLGPIVPIGLFLGRIANFVNGELWGKVSLVSWAVIFPKSAAIGVSVDSIAPRHPSQLYEAALEGLVLFICIQLRFWCSSAQKTPGRLSSEFLVLYGILRIIGEQFREPDAALILGMSRGTFYSLFIILVGLFLVFPIRRIHRLLLHYIKTNT